ncbi:biotin transporter BioY [Lachnospiraceae bacterium YH-ros2226]|nr:biotin transporter BioY [Lachnospiraceae bacterium]MDD6449181.1 biotin transporter BioY [Lachnospiraceae bacterium]MDD6450633.1 biotin transporter BioY [Lachnospiraceae bacterium]MDD6577986.1 biotin transporter BioY [Lachnospiraceae bacterium]
MQGKAAKSKFGTRDLTYCAMFVALMFVGAKINIVLPIGSGVTISLQIMFAVITGLLLGPRNGLISLLVYLFLGLLGVPVYAHGGGMAYILRPTYGFLLGFASAAWLSGTILNHFRKKDLKAYLFAGEIGMLSYYFFGLLYFALLSNVLLKSAQPIGFKELMSVWFLSTAWVDAVIAGVGSYVACKVAPLFSRMKESMR